MSKKPILSALTILLATLLPFSNTVADTSVGAQTHSQGSTDCTNETNRGNPECATSATVSTPARGGTNANSGSLDDSAGTIESASLFKGWSWAADLRAAYNVTNHNPNAADSDEDTEWPARIRAGTSYNHADRLIVGARLATYCSSESCNFEYVHDDYIPIGATGIGAGDITFDELYLHSFRREHFNLAVGRLQTKFVSRAGVFAKSLDRNDSAGSHITWTDGIHGTLHIGDKDILHLILQKNYAGGTGNVRHAPINFSDPGSRITYFAAWENLHSLGPISQRGTDLTYMPKSLQKDGTASGRITDYTAMAVRAAATWPAESDGPRLNIATEVGYAPTTPTYAAMGLSGSGDVGGFAWNISISGMDLFPRHSIGLNFAHTDAGWLISPDYNENSEIVELRYLWRHSSNLAVDVRYQHQVNLLPAISSTQLQKVNNAFVRFTLGFD